MRIIILSQSDELRVPQVPIRCPFNEFKLSNQLRFKPHTVFHFFLSQSPLGSLPLRQISKRAVLYLQALEPTCQLAARLWDKPVSNFGSIKEFSILIVSNHDRV